MSILQPLHQPPGLANRPGSSTSKVVGGTAKECNDLAVVNRKTTSQHEQDAVTRSTIDPSDDVVAQRWGGECSFGKVGSG